MSDYNGWTNYETWNVNLWSDNEEHLYRQRCRLTRNHDATAEDVREFFETVMGGTTPDLKQYGIEDEINFEELAEAWNE